MSESLKQIGMTVEEVAELLGLSVSAVYRFCRKGQIPHKRLGSRVLFCRATVLDWFSCQDQDTDFAATNTNKKVG